MITKQHAAITLLAHDSKGAIQTFKQEIPWVLLPDGIRAYSVARQPSHFEQLPDGTDTAWMTFPSEVDLRSLNKDVFASKVSSYIPEEGFPKCAIGENTIIEKFDTKNYGHKHYHALRMHIIQDIVLDRVLREVLVDVTGRFKDQYVVRWNSKSIDGATLRKQCSMFEEIGFIYLAGKVHERTSRVLNNQWFDENVFIPLRAAYPADLAENTFKYMRMSEESDARLTAKEFTLTEQDLDGFILCENLQSLLDVLDNLYAETYYFTAREM